MNRETHMELRTLESEKRMDKLALMGYQHGIAEQLNGSMGRDMMDVLEGKKQVKLSLWERIKHKMDNLLWHFSLGQ